MPIPSVTPYEPSHPKIGQFYVHVVVLLVILVILVFLLRGGGGDDRGYAGGRDDGGEVGGGVGGYGGIDEGGWVVEWTRVCGGSSVVIAAVHRGLVNRLINRLVVVMIMVDRLVLVKSKHLTRGRSR